MVTMVTMGVKKALKPSSESLRVSSTPEMSQVVYRILYILMSQTWPPIRTISNHNSSQSWVFHGFHHHPNSGHGLPAGAGWVYRPQKTCSHYIIPLLFSQFPCPPKTSLCHFFLFMNYPIIFPLVDCLWSPVECIPQCLGKLPSGKLT